MTALTNRLPEGPGSRGGSWHEPEFRRAYHRAWRAAHPEYREREALRKARRRERITEGAASQAVGFTGVLLLVIADDVAARGVTEVAGRLGVGYRAVGRWLDGSRRISADGVDAAVDAYGIDALAAIFSVARAKDLARKVASGTAANFRGRNQHTKRRAQRSTRVPAGIVSTSLRPPAEVAA